MKERIPKEFPDLPRKPELQMGSLYDPVGMALYSEPEELSMEYLLLDDGYRDIY